MSHRPRSSRPFALAAIAIAIGWAIAWIAWATWISGLPEPAVEGRSGIGLLDRMVASRAAVDPNWLDPAHVAWVMRTVLVRLSILWAASVLGILLLVRRREVARGLGRYLTEADAPLNLAILRIATFGTLLFIPAGREEFIVHAALPDALLFPPSGLGSALSSLTPFPDSARFVLIAWIVATSMAAFGLFTRASTVIAALLTLVVLGVPQLHGKVNHSHHLAWFAILLATSRCGDVLSLDAWISGRRTAPVRDVRYGVPLRFAWLLLGIVYFFPGVWKLWTGGLDWMFSDHLKHQIWHQWTTHETWRPVIDPTGSDWLLDLGGLGVVVFEMSFILLVFHRRTRLVAFALGLGFHLANQLTLNIGFISLQLIYVCLIDWQRVLGRLGVRSRRLGVGRTDGPHPQGSVVPTAVVGAILIAGNTWYGVRGDNYGWPFACYPKFAFPIREPVRTVIEVAALTPDGQEMETSFATGRGPLRTARWIGVVSRVLKLPEGDRRDAALVALVDLAMGDLPPGTRLRFMEADYSTRPEDRDDPPLEIRDLAVLRIGPSSSTDDS